MHILKHKIFIIINIVFLIMLAFLITGALEAVRNGNGFLFIPSLSFTYTPSKTFTTIPSITTAPTKTLIPTSTIDISSVKTSAVQTILAEMFLTESAKTLTNTPTATNTPESTINIGSIETNAIFSYNTEMAKTKKAVIPTSTPSVITNNKGFLEKRIGIDKSVMIKVIDGENIFWIDKYEVTNNQYSRCIEDGWCTSAGSNLDLDVASELMITQYTDYPVVNVNWIQASDYCKWTGKNLPSDAQWMTAASGNEDVSYPWGNEIPDINRLNADRSVMGLSPVGTYPSGMSFFGVMDMCGNVWEWTDKGRTAADPEADNGSRIIRGGSWRTSFSDIGIALSGEMNVDEYSDDVGFRCVYSEEKTIR
ncbi:MAG: formylglycine-generating enzyme family protein [Flexilinea sp.]